MGDRVSETGAGLLYEFTNCDGPAGGGMDVPASADMNTPSAVAEIHGCRLEVTRGRTRFPLRPVQGTEFLIGSATDCDLQISRTLPDFHALITPVDGCIRISALAAEPPLQINDVMVDATVSTRLNDGDRIAIGEIEMTIHIDKLAESGLGINGLSTEQLVDLLDQEMCEVETYETQMTQGAEALLEQVHTAAETPAAETPAAEIPAAEIPAVETPEVDDSTSSAAMSPAQVARSLIDELSEVMRALDEFAADLDHRADRMHEREGDYQRAAEFLISAQETLSRQIEAVSQLGDQNHADRSAA